MKSGEGRSGCAAISGAHLLFRLLPSQERSTEIYESLLPLSRIWYTISHERLFRFLIHEMLELTT